MANLNSKKQKNLRFTKKESLVGLTPGGNPINKILSYISL